MQAHLIKPMASNQANTDISLNGQSSFSASGEQVPAALSMMVDSMTSMLERAKIDIENVDQRARADIENIDQRARKDVGNGRGITKGDKTLQIPEGPDFGLHRICPSTGGW